MRARDWYKVDMLESFIRGLRRELEDIRAVEVETQQKIDIEMDRLQRARYRRERVSQEREIQERNRVRRRQNPVLWSRCPHPV